MSREILIAGAGLTGCVAARRLAEAGYSPLVFEERGHIGGNCHDGPDSHGILIHSYGPHIFHTRRPEAAAFLSRFTEWTDYEHRVTALLDGRILPLPFNLTSLALCLPEKAERLEKKLLTAFARGAHVPVLTLREHPDPDLRALARFVLDRLFADYTRKQWGLSPTELPPSVTARVPLRVSHDDRYFTDPFQRMPKAGFSALCAALLDHPEITLRLNTPLTRADAGNRPCLHTGAVDAFFAYELGTLPYRSVELRFEYLRQQRHLPTAVLNEPSADLAHTRTTEYRLLTGQEAEGTTISREYPCPHIPGRTIPSYPVRTPAALDLYAAYKKAARRRWPNLLFAGRLGSFRYYNMDDAVLAGFAAASVLTRRRGAL